MKSDKIQAIDLLATASTAASLTSGALAGLTTADLDLWLQTKTTDELTEGANLYYTDTRVNALLAALTTDDITEGANLYYTAARVTAHADVAANTAARHAQAHALDSTDHTGTLSWGKVSKTGSSLADLAARSHADLTNVTATQHHAALSGGNGIAVTGWQAAINPADTINWSARQYFNNGITASDAEIWGELHSAVFVKDLISAHAGELIVSKSAGTLKNDYTVGGTLILKDPPSGAVDLFDTGDIVRIKAEYGAGVGDTWISVTRTATPNTYTTVYKSGTNSVTYPAGTGAVDYGTSGDGIIAIAAGDNQRITLSDTTATPYTALSDKLIIDTDSGIGLTTGLGSYNADVRQEYSFLHQDTRATTPRYAGLSSASDLSTEDILWLGVDAKEDSFPDLMAGYDSYAQLKLSNFPSATLTVDGGSLKSNYKSSLGLTTTSIELYVGSYTVGTGAGLYLYATSYSLLTGKVIKLESETTIDLEGSGVYLNGTEVIDTNNNLVRYTHSSGYLVGSYNSVGGNAAKTNPIYTIGSNYMPSDDALISMYGIGYAHTNAPFITGILDDFGAAWGMYVAADGDARIWLDGSHGSIAAVGNAKLGGYADAAGGFKVNGTRGYVYVPYYGRIMNDNWNPKSVVGGTTYAPQAAGRVPANAKIARLLIYYGAGTEDAYLLVKVSNIESGMFDDVVGIVRNQTTTHGNDVIVDVPLTDDSAQEFKIYVTHSGTVYMGFLGYYI